MITGAQVRIARYALRLSVSELSIACGVSISTVKRIEAQDGVPASTGPNINAIKSSLEAAGIEFIGTPDDGPGIRIRTSQNVD